MKSSLEIVREKVIAAVPEIAEKRTKISFNGDQKSSTEITVLIRQPSLADVLRAIESTHNWPPYRIGTHGLFVVAKQVSATPDYVSTGIVWDLSRDLSGQSPETLDFLAKVLSDK